MIKQVIVMRVKYPDGKGALRGLRTGKLIAQGSHGSGAHLSHIIRNGIRNNDQVTISLTDEELAWIDGSFTKICTQVDTEEELDVIYKDAIAAGLTAHMITDAGATEFSGVPTKTCVAIGPHEADRIDPITRHLKLL